MVIFYVVRVLGIFYLDLLSEVKIIYGNEIWKYYSRIVVVVIEEV